MHLSHDYLRFITKSTEKEEISSVHCTDIYFPMPRVPEACTHFDQLVGNTAWDQSNLLLQIVG